jgi:hypothetical protein
MQRSTKQGTGTRRRKPCNKDLAAFWLSRHISKTPQVPRWPPGNSGLPSTNTGASINYYSTAQSHTAYTSKLSKKSPQFKAALHKNDILFCIKAATT